MTIIPSMQTALRLLSVAPLLLALVSATACGGAPAAEVETGVAPTNERAAELETLYRARLEEDRGRFVEEDVRFMTGMIAHHAQAIVMTDLVPDRAADASVRLLAARIGSAQEDEIALMQRWLRDRGRPAPEVHISGTHVHLATPEGVDEGDDVAHGEAGHHDHSGHDHAEMPGMLSQDRLDALARAEGDAFEQLFLTSMIEHHRGAVLMVRGLFGTDGAARDPELFRFAADVHADQAAEIARMERMLARMGGTPAGN